MYWYVLKQFNYFVGVSWVDMHKLANRILLTDLRDAGLLQGDVDEMMEVSTRRIKLYVVLKIKQTCKLNK
jgi:hypothetical protein